MRRDGVAALLDPRSVAVIGASTDPLKRGNQALRRLLADGYPHPVYAVHPTEGTILGFPTYPSVQDIQDPVDLALVVTPAAQVPDLLRACGRKGVAAAVVVAAGFAETGEDGRRLEEELSGIAAEYGICLVGPNTNGIFNLPASLNLVGVSEVPDGPVSLVCQSGNMALALLSQAAYDTQLGFSVYVGIGNEAGVRYHELLPFLRDDPNTRAVLMYAEGFRDGRELLRGLCELTRTKPVVVHKAASSVVGQRTAMSHTGAIAGSVEVAEAVLRQAGAIVVERTDELVAVCETVLLQPQLASPGVAVLADGGGHATVAADALTRSGLALPLLGDTTRRRLREVLTPAASTRNPVDVAGATDRDPHVFTLCLDILYDDPQIDGILCVGLLGGYAIRFSPDLARVEEQVATLMAERSRRRGKALVVQSVYAHARPPAHELLQDAGVPVYGSVETAARALASLWERGRALRSDAPVLPELAHRRADGPRRALSEPESRKLLARHGVDTGPWTFAVDAAAAAHAASGIGRPVALKIVSPDVIHKSDAGGVVLGVSPQQAHIAFGELVVAVRRAVPDARVDGVMVVPMAPPGVELLVGAATDPSFGPVLTLGAGGTAVELLGDRTFRAVPVEAFEASAMLDELAIAPLLKGYRGREPVDIRALTDLLSRISRLVAEQADILELDLNPVIAHASGYELVDVRAVVGA